MKAIFVNAKIDAEMQATKPAANDAIIGLNLNEDNTLSKEGIPQHRIYSAAKIVTFGMQRLQRQEDRNSVNCIAGQALNFRIQHPKWYFNHVYRPIYDIGIDDSLAAAILDEEIGPNFLSAGTTVRALIAEIIEWNANRYSFVKQQYPRLLNRFLNEFPYPFKDVQGKTRNEACELYLYDQEAWLDDNITTIEPAIRTFPRLNYQIKFKNDQSVMILVESDKYGSDDLVAQEYLQANPGCARIILIKRLYNSVKYSVSIVNADIYGEDLSVLHYPEVKELNAQEKKIGGDPSWKNLKLTCIGPRKGTGLSFQTVWDLSKLGE